MEAQNRKLAEEAKWTILEVEQILIFMSNSLLMSFPLYIVCKHNHICGVEVCNYLTAVFGAIFKI